MASHFPTIHLRQESKPYEHRSFSPSAIASLVQAGYPVNVERTTTTDLTRRRVFPDDDYEAVGAKLVPGGSWVDARPGTLILGLKELPAEDSFALNNDHIAYMHIFKNQGGWREVMKRFLAGRSILFDLEFLIDDKKRKCNAFSYWAGFCGAALALKTWTWRLGHPTEKLPSIELFTNGRGYYSDEKELLHQIREDLKWGVGKAGRLPNAIIIGESGICGKGAKDLFFKVGIGKEHLTRWDMEQTTARRGPFEEILLHDIFINTIYLSGPTFPFVTKELLAKPGRTLGVIVDISCDVTSPFNPIPIYDTCTSFANPTSFAEIPQDNNLIPLFVISIDHLPSMLPRESSEAFSDEMDEWLLQLKDRTVAPAWKAAKAVFDDKMALVTKEK